MVRCLVVVIAFLFTGIAMARRPHKSQKKGFRTSHSGLDPESKGFFRPEVAGFWQAPE